ncbi:hypothetical protein WJ0W_004711 [Paenibacillus melissococcoides]|uniref:Uncharacterized protein n=1 Tax=Paenibacillus melissococcoides TaxID=2912268 RepID=A0ABM9G6I8_9BACL|nr:MULTISPECIES: hypothetical protein [Paenibacillus]MEB9896365.1 hypothetical protein [Bacillus cereus]QVQ56241.1 hypothetical protein [Paenibacillus phage Pd_22F]CAH8247476.1 hypothetical protein WJ0W_004711 [Paenibacillus melissococcoides]CAH8705100.1 hypothetical protein HTL2_000795 [Paenibacillus melissococcoides]CAH8714512.1 hypothetical protein WDD9_003915 [Paenibacillus melissococcoides]
MKVRIRIKEVLTYDREAIISIPEDVPESKINKLLDEAERRSDMADEVIHHLRKLGCGIVEGVDYDLSSPDETEVEVFDYEIMLR